jgi:hypothetical protein
MVAAVHEEINAGIIDVNRGRIHHPVADVLAARNIPFVFITGYGVEASTAGPACRSSKSRCNGKCCRRSSSLPSPPRLRDYPRGDTAAQNGSAGPHPRPSPEGRNRLAGGA